MNEYLQAVNSGQLCAIVAIVLLAMTAVCTGFPVKRCRAGVTEHSGKSQRIQPDTI